MVKGEIGHPLSFTHFFCGTHYLEVLEGAFFAVAKVRGSGLTEEHVPRVHGRSVSDCRYSDYVWTFSPAIVPGRPCITSAWRTRDSLQIPEGFRRF